MAAAAQTVSMRDPRAAALQLAQALGHQPAVDLWNDWAAAQALCGAYAEAAAGFRCALAMEERDATAHGNLAWVAAQLGRWQEADACAAAATAALPTGTPAEVMEKLAAIRRHAAPHLPRWTAAEAEACLLAFRGTDENGLDYFQTHFRRYLATMEMVPAARPGGRLLELGASFHHLSPLLRRLAGYAELRGSDIWSGGASTVHTATPAQGKAEQFEVDNFDVEHAPWPYPDASFDVVLCCEILEHLALDPMAMLAEINRVLQPDGCLLLTTPNIASAHALAAVAQGEAPYGWGQFEPAGIPTDRHNREYSTAEVARLLMAAGLEPVVLDTRTFYWPQPPRIWATMVALHYPIAYRGDTTLVLARKSGSVRDRHPAEFYQTRGTQQQRRES